MASNMRVHPGLRGVEGEGCSPAVVRDEGAEGEEGCPEVAFGIGVIEGRGQSGEPETAGALRPSEPHALRGFRKRHLRERVVA